LTIFEEVFNVSGTIFERGKEGGWLMAMRDENVKRKIEFASESEK
jgi:hypothetical protein